MLDGCTLSVVWTWQASCYAGELIEVGRKQVRFGMNVHQTPCRHISPTNPDNRSSIAGCSLEFFRRTGLGSGPG